ncbi:MAG: tetratricopeptide repeat protein, partial [Bacteroidales bacterium]|nr:tetratricopeptide repeat protein [Bacteroidales bacterium]
MLLANKTIKDIWIYTILILSVIVFLPSLKGEFLNWDDTTYIRDNEILNKDIGITSFLELYEYDAYISLTLFSFQVQTKIFGNNPFYFHFFNILIHLINVFLVFYLAKVLLENKTSAFWLALIFAIHPFRVESVAWIIQRKDLLYSFFFLTGILTYLKFLKTDKLLWYLITIFLAYFAIISKIPAITFVLILALFEIYIYRKISLKSVLLLLLIGLIQITPINSFLFTTLYIFVPIMIVYLFNKYSENYKNLNSNNTPFLKRKTITILSNKKHVRIILFLYIIIFMFFLVIPTIKSFFKSDLSITLTFITKTVTYFSPVLILYILNKNNQIRISKIVSILNRRKYKILKIILGLLFLGIIIYFVAVTKFEPGEFSSNNFLSLKTIQYLSYSLGFYIGGFFYPFYQNGMYPYPDTQNLDAIYKIMPIIIATFSIAIGVIIYKIKDVEFRRKIIFGLLFFLINIFIVLHIIPIKGRVIVAERYSYLAYFGLIFILITIFQNIYDRNKVVYKSLINILLLIIISSYAIQTYSRSKVFANDYTFWSDVIENNPKNHYAKYALGLYYFENGDFQKAIKFYNQAIELYPRSYEYFLNRGSSYLKIGEPQTAFDDYNAAINLDSTQSLCYKNRGILLYNIGQPELAFEDLKSSLQFGNNDKEVFDIFSKVDFLCKQKTEFSETGTSGKELSDYYSEIAIKSFKSD